MAARILVVDDAVFMRKMIGDIFIYYACDLSQMSRKCLRLPFLCHRLYKANRQLEKLCDLAGFQAGRQSPANDRVLIRGCLERFGSSRSIARRGWAL